MTLLRQTRIVDSNGQEWITEPNGGMPVNLQDQTSAVIIAHLRKETGSPTTLTADTVIDSKIISVASVAGTAVGETILLRSVTDNRFSFFKILAINTLDITVDSPIDFAFTVANTAVNYAITNMNVNGSVTPQIFSLRAGSSPQIPLVVDITRIIIAGTCSSAVSLGLFGNLSALLNGCVFRHTDGQTRNIFNVKTNLEMSNICFDFDIYSATGQGLDGFVCRITFAGQNKMGVALRVMADEDLEFIVQDNLTTITSLEVIAEGHVVVD